MITDSNNSSANLVVNPTGSRKLAEKPYSQSWQKHLATLELHSGIMSRGRSVLRKSGIRRLVFSEGMIRAEIFGAERVLFEPTCGILPLKEDTAATIRHYFSDRPHVFAEFYSGNFSPELRDFLCRDEADGGMFPNLLSLKFSCNCTEDEAPCSHSAAVLYGIGTLLDSDPKWLTRLRGVDLQSVNQAQGMQTLGDLTGDVDLSVLFSADIT